MLRGFRRGDCKRLLRSLTAAVGMTALAAGAAFADGSKWVVEPVIKGGALHGGPNGMAFDHDGKFLVGSVLGQTLFEVDPETGAVKDWVAPGAGMADDIAIGPDGTVYWTCLLLGEIHARKGDGPVRVVASGLPGVDSIAFHPDGRLFESQDFAADVLQEIDPAGVKPPRKVLENLDTKLDGAVGGLNGFQFGKDGRLYGPLWNKGQVIAIDVDSRAIEPIAEGFRVPSSVRIDSRGNLWTVDYARGELVRVDAKTHAKTIAAERPNLKPVLDNLAIDKKDRIYISNSADNSIEVYEGYDPATGEGGKLHALTAGRLSVPGGLTMAKGPGGDELYLADFFAFRRINPGDGQITDVARMQAEPLIYPTAVTSNDKTLVLSSWFGGTLQVIDRATESTVKVLAGFTAPQDALQLEDGSFLVAELGTGKLLKVSADGEKRSALAEGLGAPVGLASDGKSVFVTEFGAGLLTRFDLASGERSVVAKGLAGPEGVAIASGGSLVVAETGKKRIVSIDAKSGEVAEIAGGLKFGDPGPAGLPPSYIATGVAIGSDGSIYFDSAAEGALYRIAKR
jgi:sugar lactone lactonase YvrE